MVCQWEGVGRGGGGTRAEDKREGAPVSPWDCGWGWSAAMEGEVGWEQGAGARCIAE